MGDPFIFQGIVPQTVTIILEYLLPITPVRTGLSNEPSLSVS